jgi:psp operon transcriptional activator
MLPAEMPSPIGAAPAFTDLLDHVSAAAPLDRPVLVIGERGTGKELIAARLHYLSRRWDRPFVRVNCAALSPELLDSELFGHEAGSFTGATRRHVGRFERADRGTLVLDELATASLRIQEKILRVVEYGEYERVGGTETRGVDVRIIGTTNVDLPAEAAAGRFRADLLDRLAFDVLTIPPLRARPEDILPLATHFAQAMAHELDRPAFPGFSTRARAQLMAHGWPGNVRELKNVAERAVYRTPGGRAVEDIPLDPFDSPWTLRAGQAEASTRPPPSFPALPLDFEIATRDHAVALLRAALTRAGGHRGRAAALLGLGYDRFRYLLRTHEVGAGTDER